MDRFVDILGRLGDPGVTAMLLRQDFVMHALVAIALLALMAGVIGPFIVMRQMSFSVHGTSELALTGASAALLFGFGLGTGAILGAVVAALLFGVMGVRARDRDSSIGVVMAFGLGLSVLFIHLYPGRAGSSFALLTGQIVGVSGQGIALMAAVCAIVVGAIAVLYRPLVFSSVDPEVAAARGVPVRALNLVFAVLVGLAAAQAVQVVGALLVMALLITPAAAAAYVARSPGTAIALAVVLAEVSAVGGLLLSLAPGVPVSVFVTTLSFVLYLVCRGLGALRAR